MKTPESQPVPHRSSLLGWSVAALALVAASAAGQDGIPLAKPTGEQANAARPAHVRIEAVAGRLLPGKTNFIGLIFRIEPKWHIYWDGLNDTGAAPEFTVALPDGWTQGKTRWPAPKRYVLPGDIVDYIYEDEVTLVVPIDIPESAAGTQADLAFDVRWLVCSDVCIPEKGSTKLLARVAKSDAPSAEPPRAPRQIAETLYRRLPRPMKEAQGVKVSVVAGVLRIEAVDARRIRFMPASMSVGLDDAAADGEAMGTVLLAELARPEGEHTTVVGIIQIDRGKGTESYWYDESELPEVDEPVPGAAPATGTKKTNE